MKKISLFVSLAVSLGSFTGGVDARSITADSGTGDNESQVIDHHNLYDAIKKGELWLTFHLRNENVEQNNPLRNANATTLQTRLGYQSARFYGFDGLIEVANVQNFFGHRYDSGGGTSPAEAGIYSVIADPTATVLNRAVLTFSNIPDSWLKVGRRRIKLDNDRFIGNVGFRQTEQRFDSFTAQTQLIPYTTAQYGYIWDVRRVFTPKATAPAASNFNARSHYINIKVAPDDKINVIPYAYLINDKNAPATSSNTYGARVTGKWGIDNNNHELMYAVEGASQKGAHNNPNRYSQGYYHVVLGGNLYKTVVLRAAQEALKGNGTVVNGVRSSFATPYATLHKFNGWADVFLVTPAAGLRDTYGKVGIKFDSIDVETALIYHDFRSTTGSTKYGSELDLKVGKDIFKDYGVAFYYANYNARAMNAINPTVSTKKVWLAATAKFS